MPRIFYHLRDGVDHLIDPEGRELPDLDAARKQASICAFDILAADIRVGKLNLDYRIDVEDEAGNLLHTVNFRDLVTITGLRPS